jgi:hypothetical protein
VLKYVQLPPTTLDQTAEILRIVAQYALARTWFRMSCSENVQQTNLTHSLLVFSEAAKSLPARQRDISQLNFLYEFVASVDQ